MKVHDWNSLPSEQMNSLLSRRVVHTGRMTIARLVLTKGAHVPTHSHENEQVSMVESGRLLFRFPDGDVEVGQGQSMEIAPNLPHSVDALEDTLVTDLFAPCREDWIRGDDAYLRR